MSRDLFRNSGCSAGSFLRSGAVHPPLRPGEVHVWCLNADDFQGCYQDLYQVLDVGERGKAQQYSSVNAQRRYVVRHGLLRVLLSRYMEQCPSSFAFKFESAGKPALEPGADELAVRFSSSSSNGQLVLAFASDRNVGVDVETIRSVNWVDIAPWFLSADEIEHLRHLSPGLAQLLFFRYWSRMEACVKVDGTGIRTGVLKETIEDPPWSHPGVANGRGLCVRDLIAIPGTAAAVASTGTDWSIRMFRYDEKHTGEN